VERPSTDQAPKPPISGALQGEASSYDAFEKSLAPNRKGPTTRFPDLPISPLLRIHPQCAIICSCSGDTKLDICNLAAK